MDLTSATDSSPAHSDTLVQAGVLLLQAEAWDLALAALDRAHTSAAVVPLGRARALEKLQRPREAAEALLPELRARPTDGALFDYFCRLCEQLVPLPARGGGGFVSSLLGVLHDTERAAPQDELVVQPPSYAAVAETVWRLLADMAPYEQAFAALSSDHERACVTAAIAAAVHGRADTVSTSVRFVAGRSESDVQRLTEVLERFGLPTRPGLAALQIGRVARGEATRPTSAFLTALAAEVERCRTLWWDDNFDELHLGPYVPEQHRSDLVGEKAGAQPLPPSLLQQRIDRFWDVDALYWRLADAESRSLLVSLFAYRLLGFRRVRLPRNTPAYAAGIAQADGWATTDAPLPIKYQGLSLRRFDLASLGHDARLFASAAGLACTFVQEQYAYRKPRLQCQVEPGDVVIDAGACWGDTTIAFALAVGDGGHVHAAEFIPSNLAVLERNLADNPALAARVQVVPKPLWSSSGRRLHFVDWGPGSRIVPNAAHADGTCQTISIDDLATERAITRVGFVKMDIEGAEWDTLSGASRVLRRDRPKLAISVYHRLADIVTIPALLDDLGLGYELALDHHTMYLNETVLFAVPAAR